MIVDFPGVMTEFAKVQYGEFFIFFDDERPAFAMKIFDATSNPKAVAVISFSTAGHPTMTPPTCLNAGQFQNRDVCVVRDVVIRPFFQVAKLCAGSPSIDKPGPIIFAGGRSFIRAWERRGTLDVDLATGAAEASRSHPGSISVEDWEIILVRPSDESALCNRGKPAAK